MKEHLGDPDSSRLYPEGQPQTQSEKKTGLSKLEIGGLITYVFISLWICGFPPISSITEWTDWYLGKGGGWSSPLFITRNACAVIFLLCVLRYKRH